MFDGNETGNEPEHLGGTALRLKQNFFIGDELLRRGGDRTFADDRDFGDFNFVGVRVMGGDPCRFAYQTNHADNEKPDEIVPAHLATSTFLVDGPSSTGNLNRLDRQPTQTLVV